MPERRITSGIGQQEIHAANSWCWSDQLPVLPISSDWFCAIKILRRPSDWPRRVGQFHKQAPHWSLRSSEILQPNEKEKENTLYMQEEKLCRWWAEWDLIHCLIKTCFQSSGQGAFELAGGELGQEEETYMLEGAENGAGKVGRSLIIIVLNDMCVTLSLILWLSREWSTLTF